MGALKNKLYILHGWSTNTQKWDPFLSALQEIGIEPILLKIPGLTAQLDAPWTLSDYVEWLNLKTKEENKVAILGHSNGGRIALAFCLKYQNRVKHLFLVDSAGIYHNDILTQTKRNVFKTLSALGKKITKSESARNLLYKVVRENDYNDATPVQKETMKNLISVDLLPELHKITAPTTIIWGKNDTVTPYTDALIMQNSIHHAELFSIKDAHHSPQFTHVSEVVKIVKETLS